MKKTLLFAVVAFAAIFVSACVEKRAQTQIDPANYIVKFGIFEKETYLIAEETTTIPMQYKDTGFGIGYMISSRDQSDFEEYSIAYPPRDGVAGDEIKRTGTSTGLKGPVGKSRKGDISHKFGFDPGDPSGTWLIDIFVNDQLVKSITFEVLPPKA